MQNDTQSNSNHNSTNRNAENVEEAVALSLIEDLRTDVVTKLKQKIDERATGIFAQASAPNPKADAGPAGDAAAAGGDNKPQSAFSAMLQAATRYVHVLYTCAYTYVLTHPHAHKTASCWT